MCICIYVHVYVHVFVYVYVHVHVHVHVHGCVYHHTQSHTPIVYDSIRCIYDGMRLYMIIYDVYMIAYATDCGYFSVHYHIQPHTIIYNRIPSYTIAHTTYVRHLPSTSHTHTHYTHTHTHLIHAHTHTHTLARTPATCAPHICIALFFLHICIAFFFFEIYVLPHLRRAHHLLKNSEKFSQVLFVVAFCLLCVVRLGNVYYLSGV